MSDTGKTFVTLGEAATLLSTTELRVLMMIKRAQLQGKMVEDSWYVDRSTLHPGASRTAGDLVKSGCGGCGSRCGSV